MTLRRLRSGFTIAEAIVVVLLAVMLIAAGVYLLIYGSSALERTSETLGAQQSGRVAVARMVRAIQQCIEVISSLPGCTLPYAVVRNQISCARWY